MSVQCTWQTTRGSRGLNHRFWVSVLLMEEQTDKEDWQYSNLSKAGTGDRMDWKYKESESLKVLGKISMVSFSQSPSLKISKWFLILPSSSPCSYLSILFLEWFSVNHLFSHFSSHPQMQATNTTCLGNYSNNLLNVSLLLIQIHPYICHYTARLVSHSPYYFPF